MDLLPVGYFRLRLVPGGRWVGLRCWFGQPPDPDHPGQTLDRSPRWMYQVGDGEVKSAHAEHDMERAVWSSREEITKEEYEYLVALVAHDVKHGTGANPRKKVDFNRLRFDHIKPGEKK